MMKYSTQKRRNSPNLCPQWMDTDMFTYQDNMTAFKYSTKAANGKENIAIGFAIFITSDEWAQYTKSTFDVRAREQYLERMPHQKPDYCWSKPY